MWILVVLFCLLLGQTQFSCHCTLRVRYQNQLEVVSEFTYVGLTMSSNLSLEPELSRRIGKASAVMSRLSKRVWENKN